MEIEDNLTEFEQELAMLRPMAPSPGLCARMGQRLATDGQDEEAALAALEMELQALRPERPPAEFAKRMKQLTRPQAVGAERGRRVLAWAWGMVAGMAAAAALVWGWRQPGAMPVTQPSEVTVVAAPEAGAAIAPAPATQRVEVLAFADPRAQAMLSAGYRPVSLGQEVLGAEDITPEGASADGRQTRVQVRQAIRWSNERTGAQIHTSQVHEAVIRGTASYY